MLTSLLIANRGEIARRIIRTARAMGVRTIAVHSDVDAGMPFVREADEAVCIGPAPAAESYLRGDKIIAAAQATCAQAVHPGYGFLSENADFAEAVVAAGLIWVGAPPASIRAMGLKDAAKKLMASAGVPVTPGYLGEDQSPDRLAAEAQAIGYPVLIKAVAGGGGKGMRKVDAPQDFADALASCRREAAAAFGDDRVLIEKYVLNPRHIEVQVFGDSHGNVVHLFERDCSLQRRHQKVIEEAPAPGMDTATRAAICAAAVKAAQAVSYVGAGTIEFIADASEGLRADRIWFMEMNTRLQVEHPVTEAITGQDLVEWQLRVASGEALPKRQDQLAIDGHAIEARLYAEDPAKGFLPSIGRLEHFRTYAYDPVRIDSAVEQGDSISTYYDPMIAKVIAHGPTRDDAIDALIGRMDDMIVWPVHTNANFVGRTLRLDEFRSGRVDTGLLGLRHGELTTPEPISESDLAPVAALMAVPRTVGPFDLAPSGPWDQPSFLRLNRRPDIRLSLFVDGSEHIIGDAMMGVPYRTMGESLTHGTVIPLDRTNALLCVRGATMVVSTLRAANASGSAAAGDGAILAPMPGRIVAVDVAEGDTVTAGQKLVVIEAMKMEQALVAPFDGTVTEVKVVAGGQTSEGALLVRLERAE